MASGWFLLVLDSLLSAQGTGAFAPSTNASRTLLTDSSVVIDLNVQQLIGTPPVPSSPIAPAHAQLHSTAAPYNKTPARTPAAGEHPQMRVAAFAGIASASIVTRSADATRPNTGSQPHGRAALLGTAAQGFASRQMLQGLLPRPHRRPRRRVHPHVQVRVYARGTNGTDRLANYDAIVNAAACESAAYPETAFGSVVQPRPRLLLPSHPS